MSDSLKKRLSEQGIDIELTQAALEKITEEGYDPDYGARPLRRALHEKLKTVYQKNCLRGNINKGQTVKIDVEQNDFVVETV